MAKLVIVTKDKPTLTIKAFECFIGKLCTLVIRPKDPNILYHDGKNVFPIDGDTIYTMNNTTMQYELFKNNSAALVTYLTTSGGRPYVVTNDNGICKINNCKPKWQHSQ